MTIDSSLERLPSIFPGATIASRFRLVRLLGRGSMGSVWLARHLSLDVDVAVKFIDGALRDRKEHRSRFALEAQAAARINSPHVVSVLDFGAEESGRLYIAMEYLQGEDLAKVLDRSTAGISVETSARIVSHVCRGLSRAHALGISHRDIKPENLFLCGGADDDDFVLKILDFGVAKSAEKTEVDLVATAAGQLVGSPAYMSPEQARGSLDIDFRSDLFSLAVVVYHCLTGCLPFAGESLTDVLVNIVSKEPIPPSHFAPDLPRSVDDWFRRALDKKPSRRFPSAKDFGQAFQMALGQYSSSASDYASSGTILSRTVVDLSPSSEVMASVLPVAPSSRPHSMRVSNQAPTVVVAQALAQVADVAHVMGVALVAPAGDAIAHQSQLGLPAATFLDIAARVQTALDAFDSLEAASHQALALHFTSLMVLVRWVDGHLLLALATEHALPTVLSVSMNAAVTKLLGIAKPGGIAQALGPVLVSASAPVPARSAFDSVEPPLPTPPRSSGIILGQQPQSEVDAEAAKSTRAVFYRGHKVEE